MRLVYFLPAAFLCAISQPASAQSHAPDLYLADNPPAADRGGQEVLIATRRDDWDFISTWLSNDSTHFEYNSAGKVSTRTNLSFDGIEWVFTNRVLFGYNGAQLTETIVETWDGNDWIGLSRTSREFDANGYLSVDTRYTWDGQNWANFRKYTYDNTLVGLPVQSLFQTWDGQNWTNKTLTLYEYNVLNQQTEVVVQNWDNNAWLNVDRNLFSYNIQGLQETYIQQDWTGNMWENYSRDSFIFDANLQLTEILHSLWNANGWDNYQLSQYGYDAQGNNTSYTGLVWENNAWLGTYRSQSTFGAFDLLANTTDQYWTGTEWLNFSSADYTYTPTGRISLLQRKLWDNVAWVNDYRILYFYDTFTDAKEENTHEWKVNAFPNPSTGVFTISAPNMAHLEVFAPDGRLCYRQQAGGNDMVTVSNANLNPGQYWIRVVTRDNLSRVMPLVIR